MNEKTIQAILFENTVLSKIQEDDEKKFILSIWVESNDKKSYSLSEGLSKQQKDRLYDILEKVGYKKDPIEKFPDFVAELQGAQVIQSFATRPLNKVQEVSSQLQQAIQNLKIRRAGAQVQEIEVAQKTRESLFKQIIGFRRGLFYFLLVLMATETFILFAIVITTSVPVFNDKFQVNDTTLQILVGATIAQISTMLIIIIKSVFPDSINKIMGSSRFSEKDEKETEKS